MFISAIFIQTILSAAALAVHVGTTILSERGKVFEQSAFAHFPVSGVTASHEGVAAAPPTLQLNNAGAGIAGVGGDFTIVTGEFDVPVVRVSDPGVESAAIPFVVLDLFDCTYFFGAGVWIVVSGDSVDYIPFWQWGSLGSNSNRFRDVQVTANDEISITLQTTSPTTGSVSITKNAGEQSQTILLSFPDAPLCRATPSWLVITPSNVPLANFVDIAFDNALAGNGTVQAGPLDPRAFAVNIQRNGTTFTEVGRGRESVTIRYTR